MKHCFYLKAGAMSVQVSVWHLKVRQALCVSVYPASKGAGETTLVHITQGMQITLEPMPRLNRKRLEAAFEEAKRQVAAKSGPVYDLVLRLCHEHDLTLAEAVA